MSGRRSRLRPAVAIALGVALIAPSGASAQVTLTEGTNVATTPNFELNFGNDIGVAGGDGNAERVDTLRWTNTSGGVLGANVTAPGLSGFCPTGTGPGHFWGQSYADHDGGSPAPVMAGSVGNWDPVGTKTVEINTVAPTPCTGSDPLIPVRSRYSFFSTNSKRNVIRVERRWEFGPGHPVFAGTHGLRAYVPRLAVATYDQVVYPKADESALITTSSAGPAFSTDWNNKWVALNASSTNAGLMILRDPSNTSPARVVTDNDGGSNSNLSGVTLVRPAATGWTQPLEETEYLCFYDATSWPVATRSATNLPNGCALGAVPINTDLPSVPNQDEGNPEPGNTYTADPGSWDNRDTNVPFSYQWLRCDGSGCNPIGGATSQAYQATNADFGKQLRVQVTATALGGETDTATSTLLGSLSGTVYGGSVAPGNALGAAGVEACLGTIAEPTDCRTTTANGSGQYELIGLPQGSYYVKAFPPAGNNSIPTTRSTSSAVTDGNDTTGQDVVLPTPVPPPNTIQFTGSGFRGTTGEGTPVFYWTQAVVIDVEAPIGGSVEGEIDCPGAAPIQLLPNPAQPDPLPADPQTGVFHFPVAPLYPLHGPCTIVFEIDPDGPGGADPGPPILFPVYIDPSGFVLTPDDDPVVGATVTLFRSDFLAGAFSIVPNGDAIMSPSNRENPDLTDATGHFGWDVMAGFYSVRAEKSGCRDPADADKDFVESQVYEIPPPVTNVDLRLDCDPLKVSFTGATGLGTIKVPRSGAVKLKGVTAACPDGADAQCPVALAVKKGPRKYGGGTVLVPVDASAPLSAKLTRKGKKALKKAGKLRVRITASADVEDAGGATSSKVFKAKLVPK